MKNPRNLLIFAILGGIIGAGVGYTFRAVTSPSVSTPSVADAQFKSGIRGVIDQQVKDWNAGNIEGFMNGYWRNEDLRFTSGGDVTRGWQATLDRYKKRYPDRSAMGTLALDVRDITKIGTSQALVLGHWKLTRDKDTPSGLFTLHMRQVNGEWLIVSDHTSSAN